MITRFDDDETDREAEQSRIQWEYALVAIGILSFAKEVADFTFKDFDRQIKRVTGTKLNPFESFVDTEIRDFVKENTALIKNIGDVTSTRISSIITEGLKDKKDQKTIASEIQKVIQSSEKRAALIARDQIGKLNGRLAKERQIRLGITQYQWSTMRDERVRPLHREREGKIFNWDDPPSDGHPGTPINCRCSANMLLNNKL